MSWRKRVELQYPDLAEVVEHLEHMENRIVATIEELVADVDKLIAAFNDLKAAPAPTPAPALTPEQQTAVDATDAAVQAAIAPPATAVDATDAAVQAAIAPPAPPA